MTRQRHPRAAGRNHSFAAGARSPDAAQDLQFRNGGCQAQVPAITEGQTELPSAPMVRIRFPPAKSHANHRFLPLAPVKERLSNESKGSKRHSALSAATKPQAGAL